MTLNMYYLITSVFLLYLGTIPLYTGCIPEALVHERYISFELTNIQGLRKSDKCIIKIHIYFT